MREEQHCIAPDVCLPTRPVHRLVGPISRFLHVEAMSGVVLLIVTVAALLIANSPAATHFEKFWITPIGLHLGDVVFVHSLRHWVNDGLMAIFFFVVGLEVKREIVTGELKEARSAALPIAAAIGGMVVPAGVYLLDPASQLHEDGAYRWQPISPSSSDVWRCWGLASRTVFGWCCSRSQ